MCDTVKSTVTDLIGLLIVMSLPLPPPKGSTLFRVTLGEEAKDIKYIFVSLAAGLICSSYSPAGARFFFLDTKEKTLHPCTTTQLKTRNL